MSVDFVHALVEMRPPSRSIGTSRKLTDLVEIFEVKMMLMCCLLMLLMKLCKRSKPLDQIIKISSIYL